MTITREVRPYFWALGLLWVLPAATLALGYLFLPDTGCEQCVVSERDSMLVLAIYGGPFLIVLGLVAVAIIWCVKYYNRRVEGR